MQIADLTSAEFNERMTRSMKESTWQSHVEQLARLHNWRLYHTYDSRRSHAGFPDLVLLRPPRLIFAELKTARGRIRHEQGVWLAELAGCPQVEVYTWRPADREEVLRVLS